MKKEFEDKKNFDMDRINSLEKFLKKSKTRSGF